MFTTKEIAKKLGRSEQRICQLAKLRGIEPAMTVGNAYLWHDEDFKRFALGKPGRPKGKK